MKKVSWIALSMRSDGLFPGESQCLYPISSPLSESWEKEGMKRSGKCVTVLKETHFINFVLFVLNIQSILFLEGHREERVPLIAQPFQVVQMPINQYTSNENV